MKFRIEKAIAIKPDIIRFNVETLNDAGDIIGEYQISEDVSDYLKTTIDKDDLTNIQMTVDIMGIQQLLTDRVAEMQITAFIAQQLTGHPWIAVEQDESDENKEFSTLSE